MKSNIRGFLCLPPKQVPADEVCGCPLVKDVFEPTGEFCRISKRKCNKHYCWEKLRRAEVDLERVRVVNGLLHRQQTLTDFVMAGTDHMVSVSPSYSGTSWMSCLSRRETWGQPWPTELDCWLWCFTRLFNMIRSQLTWGQPRTGRQV